ncbi:hypothetical protein GI374_17805 [Paracoccus sp. S-4012]|uniref:hypothetical protein n=1 Tax=Paracoccus sp. S-4012 TaxID=2665648 RepID=UPI0012AF7FAB|nr:hypothetical protein [Paracoccus sp. S-4012]MRX52212.1 hypothetical protein [Paracoccus sp. S-4012]
MTGRYRIAAILLAGLLTCAPAAAETASFPAAIGEAYAGRLTIDAFPADGGMRIYRAWGDAEVLFSALDDGQVRFSTTATLDDGGSLDLSTVLAPAADGAWRGLSAAGPTEISASGRVLSITYLDGFHMVLTGEIAGEDGRLTLRRIPTEDTGTAPDADMMTVFLFDVSLPRPEPEPEPEPPLDAPSASTAEGRDGCKRVEWRLVNRWTWGNGLRLDREPHCVPN